MARTPLLALLMALAVFGAACSATPSWVSVESATEDAPAELAFAAEPTATVEVVATPEPTPEPVVVSSPEFCEATANIWIHSAALNLIGAEANPEMTQVAMANVAEWLERATLFTEEGVTARTVMFEAFTTLQTSAADDFDSDWAIYQASTDYANDPAAQSYETQRSALVPFINEQCDDLNIRDLGKEAEARADELLADFATAPSTLVESDSLPGHAIFTHSSGRLIASFPSAWDHEEGRGDAIVDLIASPKIERFLNGEAVDGVRLQLREAATLTDFHDLLDATMVGSSCFRTDELLEPGPTRLNITQTFDCAEHGASIIGQYSADRSLGLIIEASFDRPGGSRTDLLRLASIANSALWS